MSWTLTTSQAAIVKAGYGANSDIVLSGAALIRWSDEAEGMINSETMYDWVSNYSSLGTNFKVFLSRIASKIIAKEIINYDQGGYTSRLESQTMMDVISDDVKSEIAILRDINVQKKMGRTD